MRTDSEKKKNSGFKPPEHLAKIYHTLQGRLKFTQNPEDNDRETVTWNINVKQTIKHSQQYLQAR